jgi:hypothetical protein
VKTWGLAAPVVALLAAPWLMGLRPSRARAIACIPFALVASIMLLAPSFALNTAFLYERFALFLLPAYGWMFAAVRRLARAAPVPRRAMGDARAMSCCWALLAVHALRAWRFGQEARGIDAAIARLEPGQRALILVFNRASSAANNPYLYIQYAAWYQAERAGMVDFNFAWFPPQIVRFRPQRLPAWLPGFEWMPERFDWTLHRGPTTAISWCATSGPCGLCFAAPNAHPRDWSDDTWTIFERRTCP